MNTLFFIKKMLVLQRNWRPTSLSLSCCLAKCEVFNITIANLCSEFNLFLRSSDINLLLLAQQDGSGIPHHINSFYNLVTEQVLDKASVSSMTSAREMESILVQVSMFTSHFRNRS